MYTLNCNLKHLECSCSLPCKLEKDFTIHTNMYLNPLLQLCKTLHGIVSEQILLTFNTN